MFQNCNLLEGSAGDIKALWDGPGGPGTGAEAIVNDIALPTPQPEAPAPLWRQGHNMPKMDVTCQEPLLEVDPDQETVDNHEFIKLPLSMSSDSDPDISTARGHNIEDQLKVKVQECANQPACAAVTVYSRYDDSLYHGGVKIRKHMRKHGQSDDDFKCRLSYIGDHPTFKGDMKTITFVKPGMQYVGGYQQCTGSWSDLDSCGEDSTEKKQIYKIDTEPGKGVTWKKFGDSYMTICKSPGVHPQYPILYDKMIKTQNCQNDPEPNNECTVCENYGGWVTVNSAVGGITIQQQNCQDADCRDNINLRKTRILPEGSNDGVSDQYCKGVNEDRGVYYSKDKYNDMAHCEDNTVAYPIGSSH